MAIAIHVGNVQILVGRLLVPERVVARVIPNLLLRNLFVLLQLALLFQRASQVVIACLVLTVNTILLPERLLFFEPCFMIPFLEPLEVSFLLGVTSWHHILIEHPVVGEDLTLQVQADARIAEVGHHHDNRVNPWRCRRELIEELGPVVVLRRVQMQTRDGYGLVSEDLLVRE